ncbi:MAG: FAD-dependent oxidoreductase [Myxococcales bacterium]|nr:FAD-dependent oxidoreductase [Myxococcales bacterium]
MKNDMATESVWSRAATPPTGALQDGERVEVLVIGAGIAGLSVAYELTRRGIPALVVDDGPVGGGQTGRTSAHLASALDDRYYELASIRGEDAARLAAESHAAAIDEIERIVAAEAIDCGFARVSGYLVLAEGDDPEVLDRELGAGTRAGIALARLPDAPIASFRSGPCLEFRDQAEMNPMQYLDGLVRAVEKAGGRLLTGVHVRGVATSASDRKVTLEDGRTILAGSVVVATGSPINDLFAVHTKQAAYLTYVVALRIPNGAMPHLLLWDTGDPYHYVRCVADPAQPGQELLLVGGEDHKTGQDDGHVPRAQRLEAWARQRFPFAKERAYAWSGQVYETLDGLGYIGADPGSQEGVFVVTGDSGMGLTHGVIAGRLLADLITGVENPWTALYDPSRKVPLAIGDYVRENANAAAQYASWLTRGDYEALDQIPHGSGAILRDGAHKLAVYKDAAGQVTTRSATCPHLAAVVVWNDGEKTWDCPAHGSRFDCKGKVIQGPANTDLVEVVDEQPEAMLPAPAD